jgi:hypothetical protein
MAKMGRWGTMPDAALRAHGLPFLPVPAAPRAAGPGAGLEGVRDRLMAERDRISGEIEYLEAHSLPRARETALAAVALAESRRTESAVERALALGGKVDSMGERGEALRKELGEVKASLCETLAAIAAAVGVGRPR